MKYKFEIGDIIIHKASNEKVVVVDREDSRPGANSTIPAKYFLSLGVGKTECVNQSIVELAFEKVS